jgi:hypothetical protein
MGIKPGFLPWGKNIGLCLQTVLRIFGCERENSNRKGKTPA